MRTNKEKELKSQKLRRILFARGILLQLGFPFHHGDPVSTWKPLSNRKSCFYKESKKKKSNPNPRRRACCRTNNSPIHGLLCRFLESIIQGKLSPNQTQKLMEDCGRIKKIKIRKLRKENPILPRRESHRFCGFLLCN